MATLPTAHTTLTDQIEAAFHYRGDVTVTLCSGETVLGYLYNREPGHYVELFRAGDGGACRFAESDVQSITLSGVDHAAGKSYQEWIAKKTVHRKLQA